MRAVVITLTLGGCAAECRVLPHRTEAEVRPWEQGKSAVATDCSMPLYVIANDETFFVECFASIQNQVPQ
jgi:hypothetical protein